MILGAHNLFRGNCIQKLTFFSLNSTRKQKFPADSLSKPHGLPGVRGPQFGKHWSNLM